MATVDRLQGFNIGVAVKPACAVTTTGANITLQGAQTIDGISVGSCERVLVKDQSDATENGIYLADSSTWIRARDFDGSKDAIPGTLVYVDRGTFNGTSFWAFNSSSTATKISIGTDNVAVSRVTIALAGVSAYSNTLLALASAAAWRSTDGLALGSASTLSSTALALLTSTGQQFVGIQSWNKGGDLASANSLTLGSTANYFDVTGGTTINTIGAVRIGTVVGLHFDSTLVLTHSTALFLPSSANIITAAGAEAEFTQYTTAADWRLTRYLSADGLPLAVVDEDTMSSNSSSKVPTQQSVKQYVDNRSFYKFTSTAVSVGTTSIKDITAINGNGSVNEVIVHLSGVSQDSANQTLLLQLGDSGGIESSGYNGGMTGVTGVSAGTVESSNSAAFALTDAVSYDAVTAYTGIITLRHLGSNVWTCSAVGRSPGSNPAIALWTASGDKTLTSELTQIRLSMTNSTAFFDGGTIAVVAR